MKSLRYPTGALVVCFLLAAGGASASFHTSTPALKHDLYPRFQEGQTLKGRTTFGMNLTLDEAEIKFGEMTLPQKPTVEMNMEGEEVTTEVIEKVAEGDLQVVKRTYDENSFKVTGQAGMSDMMEDIDESEESPLTGRTVRITRTGDGVEIKDLTNEGRAPDEQLEELSEEDKALVTIDSHFEPFLPKDAKNVGDTWDIGESFKAKATEMITAAAASSESEEDSEKIREIFADILQRMELKASGKLVSVEDNIGNLEYTIDASLTFDDFKSLIEKFADENDDVPEDMSGEITVTLKMAGTGKFNLEQHQLNDLDLAGEFKLNIDLSMTQPDMGMEVAVDGSMSGNITIAGGVEVM